MKKIYIKYIIVALSIILMVFATMFSVACLKPQKVKALSSDFENEILTGTGTRNNPYLIEDAEDFLSFALATTTTDDINGRTFAGEYIKLANSIDISDFCMKPGFVAGSGELTSGFSGASNNIDYPFKGTFDGGGNTIKLEMHITNADVAGLFNYIDGATIENLVIDGSVMISRANSDTYVGGLFGQMNNQPSTISNITVNADVRCNQENAKTAYVGGVGGFATINFNENNTNKTDMKFSNIKIGGAIASSPSTSYVGGVIGFAQMKRTGSTVIQRSIFEIKNTTLTSSASVTSSASNCFVGGVIGFAEQNMKTIVADTDIADIQIKKEIPSANSGIICGGVDAKGKLIVINCNANKNLSPDLVDKKHVGTDRLVTLKINQIKNMKYTNMQMNEKIDLRDLINENIAMHQEEETYLIDCDIKHTKNKCLTVDFNTKLVVQNSGETTVVTNIIYDQMTIYQIEFDIKVKLAMNDIVKILIIVGALLALFLIYKFVIMKLINKSGRGATVNQSAITSKSIKEKLSDSDNNNKKDQTSNQDKQ